MINYIDGNVLDHKRNKKTILIHVNNDCGGWGSGFVVPLGKKYPLAEDSYRKWYEDGFTKPLSGLGQIPFTLGRIQLVKVEPDLYIGNMIAQSQPGGCSIKVDDDEVYVRPIRLECLEECLYRVAAAAKKLDAEVIGPAFASGLAGANFKSEVEPLINKCLTRFGIQTTIYILK